MSGGAVVAGRVLLGAASGNPLAPFVIGEEGADEEEDGDDDEEKLHSGSIISGFWTLRPGEQGRWYASE